MDEEEAKKFAGSIDIKNEKKQVKNLNKSAMVDEENLTEEE